MIVSKEACITGPVIDIGLLVNEGKNIGINFFGPLKHVSPDITANGFVKIFAMNRGVHLSAAIFQSFKETGIDHFRGFLMR